MRLLRFAPLLLFAGATLGGCGSDTSRTPMAILGGYKVTISAYGKMDSDEMTLSPASNGGALLDFVYGISQVRCFLDGSKLSLPRQVLHVAHSTGTLDGYATGSGDVSDGNLTLAIDLVTAGLSLPDGGAPDAGGKVTYTVMGSKL